MIDVTSGSPLLEVRGVRHDGITLGIAQDGANTGLTQ